MEPIGAIGSCDRIRQQRRIERCCVGEAGGRLRENCRCRHKLWAPYYRGFVGGKFWIYQYNSTPSAGRSSPQRWPIRACCFLAKSRCADNQRDSSGCDGGTPRQRLGVQAGLRRCSRLRTASLASLAFDFLFCLLPYDIGIDLYFRDILKPKSPQHENFIAERGCCAGFTESRFSGFPVMLRMDGAGDDSPALSSSGRGQGGCRRWSWRAAGPALGPCQR